MRLGHAGKGSGGIRVELEKEKWWLGKEWIVAAAKKIGRGAKGIVEMLLFSPGHDSIWPARSTCACIDEGALMLIEGRRFLSRPRVIRSRSYPVEGYPSPKLVASAVSGKEVTLVLPPAWVITQETELPATVGGNLAQAVEFELDRITPLRPTDALYDFTAVDKGEKLSLALSVCRAETVSPYTKALEERKIRVVRVSPAQALSSNGKRLGDLSPFHTAALVDSFRPAGTDLLARGRRTKEKPPLVLTVLLLAALATAAGAYMVLPLSIEQKRIAEIDRQIKTIKPSVRLVEQLKKEIGNREKEIALIEGFKERPLAVGLLKELTTVLPKNVWLTRTRITDTAIDLEGYAPSAAEVLPRLEASPFFRKVEFASPTFRDTRLNADRFVIRGEVESEKVKSETKK